MYNVYNKKKSLFIVHLQVHWFSDFMATKEVRAFIAGS